MPRRSRRFAIDTLQLPLFTYRPTEYDVLVIERMAQSMERARLALGIVDSIQFNRKEKAPQSLTFRMRGWGVNMTMTSRQPPRTRQYEIKMNECGNHVRKKMKE